MNDRIEPELCSLSYIKKAYRIVPVNLEDRLLLGMEWAVSVFVDTALLFGLRSASKIFTALVDALEWVVKSKGVTSTRLPAS